MRPTDENQPGSRRPNLISSSRRATGEINILAMLDGQAPGRRLRALPAIVWYGAAGVLTCSLLVALAWLVRGATPARDAGTAATAQASTRTPQPTPPARSVRPAQDSRDAGNDAADPRDGLAIDLPSMHAPLAAEGPVSVPAADTSAAPARGAVIIDVPQPAATALPAPALAANVAGGTAMRRPQPPAPRHPVTHSATPAAPSARPLPVYRTSPSQAPALAHAEPAPSRQKRSAAATRTAPPSASVDTDVALISAILLHTGARNEAADGAGTAACADKACGPRMPARQ